MLELLIVVGSLALADSVNPTTVVPALYLATQPHARAHLAGLTLGVAVVSLIGGLVLVLGPGQLLLNALPHPGHATRHVLEVIAGVVALAGSALLWRARRKEFDPPSAAGGGRSSLWLGAGIMAVELPTALPYFAAIAVIVGSGRSIVPQLLLLLVYNALFVAPLLAMLAAVVIAPQRTSRALEPIGRWLRRNSLLGLSVLAAVGGVVLLALGISGLAGR